MIWSMYVLIILLAAINYFSDKYNIYSGKVHHKFKFISLIAGISLAFLILDLLPEIYDSGISNTLISMAMILGFTIFFGIEKFIYQHERFKVKERKKDLERAHYLILFLDNLLLGLVFTQIIPSDIFHALILFLPITAFNIIQGIALHGPAVKYPKKKKFSSFITDIFLSLAAFYGFIISLLIQIPQIITILTISFIAGSFFVIIIKETMPSEKRANTLFIILGILFYSILMALTLL